MWNYLRKCSYEGVSNIIQRYLHRWQEISSQPFSGTTSISGICRKTNYHVIVTALFLYEIECKWLTIISISVSHESDYEQKKEQYANIRGKTEEQMHWRYKFQVRVFPASHVSLFTWQRFYLQKKRDNRNIVKLFTRVVA